MKNLTVLTLVLLLGACSSSTPDTMTPPTNRDWYARHSDTFDVIASDLNDVSAAATDLDSEAVYVACSSLADHVADAQALDPIPEADVNVQWQLALSDFADGAESCMTGALSMDADAISSAGESFGSGADHLQAAVDALD